MCQLALYAVFLLDRYRREDARIENVGCFALGDDICGTRSRDVVAHTSFLEFIGILLCLKFVSLSQLIYLCLDKYLDN